MPRKRKMVMLPKGLLLVTPRGSFGSSDREKSGTAPADIVPKHVKTEPVEEKPVEKPKAKKDK